jgi:uncharacterized membrane protein
MNKQQFMQILKQQLNVLSPSDVAEILADFEEHFASGLTSGKSEDEIAAELGSPYEIAQEYRDGAVAGAPPQRLTANPVPPPLPPPPSSFAAPVKRKLNEGALIVVILLNIFLGIPIWISLFSTLFGLWVTAGSLGIAAAVLFAVAIVQAGVASLILAMFGLSLTALTVLAIVLMVYLTKWLCLGLAAYVRWNRNLVMGGSPV